MQLKIGHTFFKLITSLGYIVDSYAQIPLSFETSTQGNILTLCNMETPILPLSIKANQDFIKKLGSVCDLIYTDYICENNERIISDLSSYVSLLYSDINIATVLNFGAYLINEIQTRGKIKTKYAEAAFAQLFQCVNKHIENSDLNTSDIALDYLCTLKALKTGIIDEPQNEQQTLIDRAKEYICLHYNEPISLSTIADALEVTPSYLSNLFHKTLGEPYSKYVTRIRMEQALLILKNNPGEKIYNVAAMTGFVSTKHFISVFKKHYGMSPTNYLANDRTCL